MLSYLHCFSVFGWRAKTIRIRYVWCVFFRKRRKKLRFQKHLDASVQGLTRKHVGLFASHATINALSPLTLTFLWTLVSSNEETLRQFEDFFTPQFPLLSLPLPCLSLCWSLQRGFQSIKVIKSNYYSVLLDRIALPLRVPTQKVRPSSSW